MQTYFLILIISRWQESNFGLPFKDFVNIEVNRNLTVLQKGSYVRVAKDV